MRKPLKMTVTYSTIWKFHTGGSYSIQLHVNGHNLWQRKTVLLFSVITARDQCQQFTPSVHIFEREDTWFQRWRTQKLLLFYALPRLLLDYFQQESHTVSKMCHHHSHHPPPPTHSDWHSPKTCTYVWGGCLSTGIYTAFGCDVLVTCPRWTPPLAWLFYIALLHQDTQNISQAFCAGVARGCAAVTSGV